MATVLWILAAILVISGIFAIIRKQLLWGSCSSWSACSSGQAV